MTDELRSLPQNVEIKPISSVVPYVGKPPMEYHKRLETLDDRSFVGEMKKKNKEPRGSVFAAVALILMGENAKLNDPYVLDQNSCAKGTGFDMQHRAPRAPKVEKKAEVKK